MSYALAFAADARIDFAELVRTRVLSIFFADIRRELSAPTSLFVFSSRLRIFAVISIRKLSGRDTPKRSNNREAAKKEEQECCSCNSVMTASPQPVLEYESPAERERIPFIGAMRKWRSITGWAVAFGLIVPGFFTAMELRAFVPLALAAIGLLAVSSTLTLYYMTRAAAAAEVSVGYAVRHLLLAVALYPVFLLGIFLVPRLVESDMIKWRLAARPPV